MELKIIHFYPDLMNLYGSYANVSAVQRLLERLGHSVTVETVAPGQDAAQEGDHPDHRRGYYLRGDAKRQHQCGRGTHQILAGRTDVEQAGLEGHRHRQRL